MATIAELKDELQRAQTKLSGMVEKYESLKQENPQDSRLASWESQIQGQKGKIEVLVRGKKIVKKDLLKKIQRLDKKIQIKYPVFKDLREKGYVVKTALKFGAEFRVYSKIPVQIKLVFPKILLFHAYWDPY